MRVPFHASTPNRATMFGVSLVLRQLQTPVSLLWKPRAQSLWTNRTFCSQRDAVPTVWDPAGEALHIWEENKTLGNGDRSAASEPSIQSRGIPGRTKLLGRLLEHCSPLQGKGESSGILIQLLRPPGKALKLSLNPLQLTATIDEVRLRDSINVALRIVQDDIELRGPETSLDFLQLTQ